MLYYKKVSKKRGKEAKPWFSYLTGQRYHSCGNVS